MTDTIQVEREFLRLGGGEQVILARWITFSCRRGKVKTVPGGQITQQLSGNTLSGSGQVPLDTAQRAIFDEWQVAIIAILASSAIVPG